MVGCGGVKTMVRFHVHIVETLGSFCMESIEGLLKMQLYVNTGWNKPVVRTNGSCVVKQIKNFPLLNKELKNIMEDVFD